MIPIETSLAFSQGTGHPTPHMLALLAAQFTVTEKWKNPIILQLMRR